MRRLKRNLKVYYITRRRPRLGRTRAADASLQHHLLRLRRPSPRTASTPQHHRRPAAAISSPGRWRPSSPTCPVVPAPDDLRDRPPHSPRTSDRSLPELWIELPTLSSCMTLRIVHAIHEIGGGSYHRLTIYRSVPADSLSVAASQLGVGEHRLSVSFSRSSSFPLSSAALQPAELIPPSVVGLLGTLQISAYVSAPSLPSPQTPIGHAPLAHDCSGLVPLPCRHRDRPSRPQHGRNTLPDLITIGVSHRHSFRGGSCWHADALLGGWSRSTRRSSRQALPSSSDKHRRLHRILGFLRVPWRRPCHGPCLWRCYLFRPANRSSRRQRAVLLGSLCAEWRGRSVTHRVHARARLWLPARAAYRRDERATSTCRGRTKRQGYLASLGRSVVGPTRGGPRS